MQLRDKWVDFVMSQDELERMQQKMKKLGIRNKSSYLRKMALDGYCVNLELEDVKEMVSLLRYCSNNLNQYAKRANETGSIETGKSADLIVLGANPLEDLCALRNVEQVYMAGKPVKYKAKHLPKIDAELDGIMDGLDNDPFVSEWNIAEEKKSLNPFAKRGTKE